MHGSSGKFERDGTLTCQPPSTLSVCRADVRLYDQQGSDSGRIDSSMPGLATQIERYSVVIAIGDVAIRVNTSSADFLQMLHQRYAGFVSADAHAEYDFDVDLLPSTFR